MEERNHIPLCQIEHEKCFWGTVYLQSLLLHGLQGTHFKHGITLAGILIYLNKKFRGFYQCLVHITYQLIYWIYLQNTYYWSVWNFVFLVYRKVSYLKYAGLSSSLFRWSSDIRPEY